ncbi:MBL fold metallo-hydrolase [Chloroflexota bacterium]
MIIERLEVGSFAANCYIVGDESNKEGMIIDPGAGANNILKRVKELGLKIKFIVLTHGHGDHFGALKEVKKATGAGFAMHAADASTIQSRLARYESSQSSQDFPSPDRLLKGGDSLDIGNLHFLVLHTPGHSPGGICLLGDGVVFTGDTLFNSGIGRFDMPGGSGRQILNSIQTELMVLPDDTSVYPGHGPESTIGTERQWNPFLRSDSVF